jgi:hypothetical protein
MIIGIVGWAGSGKDTIADRLIQHDFTRMSFAGTLKDAVAQVFSWDREMLEGRSAEGREWRETVDKWWAERLGIPHLTPRWVLQQWGTEVCRTSFHDAIWIASLENKLRKSNQNAVVSDCRFPNEIAAIRKQGGQIWWVQRGPMPDWYPLALKATSGKREDLSSVIEMQNSGVHVSEWAWLNNKFDRIIKNDSTLEALHSEVDYAINQLLTQPAKPAIQVSL